MDFIQLLEKFKLSIYLLRLTSKIEKKNIECRDVNSDQQICKRFRSYT